MHHEVEKIFGSIAQVWSFLRSVFSCIRTEHGKIWTGKKSVLGHFSCSVYLWVHYRPIWKILFWRLLSCCPFESFSRFHGVFSWLMLHRFRLWSFVNQQFWKNQTKITFSGYMLIMLHQYVHGLSDLSYLCLRSNRDIVLFFTMRLWKSTNLLIWFDG